MLGSRTGSKVGSGRVEMEIGKGSNAVGGSCHGRMFKFLQGLCILLSPLSPDVLPVSGQ